MVELVKSLVVFTGLMDVENDTEKLSTALTIVVVCNVIVHLMVVLQVV